MNAPEPLGIFGGTFDPVHLGHLRLAEEACEQLGLASLRWIPAGQPPHRGTPLVTGAQRLAMVQLATADNPHFTVDPAEIEADRPSYTVPTLERLRAEHGTTRPLILLLGADAFAGLMHWHRWESLLDLAHLAISHRPGTPLESTHIPDPLSDLLASRRVPRAGELHTTSAGRIFCFAMTQLAVSATQIRHLTAAGKSTRYLLSDPVIAYIQQHSLYQAA